MASLAFGSVDFVTKTGGNAILLVEEDEVRGLSRELDDLGYARASHEG
jgi:uncharacterized protein YlbG (UPF0298 family)